VIDDWLSEVWPTEVVEAMRRFSQGDLIEKPPFFFAGASKFAVTSFVRELGDPEEEDELFDLAMESRPPYGLITTETCDIAEGETDRPRQPFILIAPVYNLSGRIAAERERLITDNRVGYIRHLKGSALPSGLWVADLRIEIPVEKSLLVGRHALVVLDSEVERLELAGFLAARRDRPVLPEKVHVGVIRPLRRWVEGMNPAKRALLLDGVEVRLAIAGPRHDPDGLGLMMVSDAASISTSARAVWDARYEHMKTKADATHLTLLAHEYTTLDDVSARRYLESVRIDLSFG